MSSISLFPTNAYSTLNTAAARPANQPTTALAQPAYTSQPAMSVSPQMLVQVLALLLPLLMQALSGARQNTAPVAPPVAQPTTPASPWAALSPASTAPASPWAALSPASTAPASPWAALSPASTAPATQARPADYISEVARQLGGLEPESPSAQALLARADAADRIATGSDKRSPRLQALILDVQIGQLKNTIGSLRVMQTNLEPKSETAKAVEARIKAIEKIQVGLKKERAAIPVATEPGLLAARSEGLRRQALYIGESISELTNTIAAIKKEQSGLSPSSAKFKELEERLASIRAVQAGLQKQRQLVLDF